MDNQRFCLSWDGFRDSVSSLLDQLRQDGELLDVTLCCEGLQVRAHRLVLSMCSPYFRQVLKVSAVLVWDGEGACTAWDPAGAES